jgi:hypothetical protein
MNIKKWVPAWGTPPEAVVTYRDSHKVYRQTLDVWRQYDPDEELQPERLETCARMVAAARGVFVEAKRSVHNARKRAYADGFQRLRGVRTGLKQICKDLDAGIREAGSAGNVEDFDSESEE